MTWKSDFLILRSMDCFAIVTIPILILTAMSFGAFSSDQILSNTSCSNPGQEDNVCTSTMMYHVPPVFLHVSHIRTCWRLGGPKNKSQSVWWHRRETLKSLLVWSKEFRCSLLLNDQFENIAHIIPSEFFHLFAIKLLQINLEFPHVLYQCSED